MRIHGDKIGDIVGDRLHSHSGGTGVDERCARKQKIRRVYVTAQQGTTIHCDTCRVHQGGSECR